LLAKSYCIFPVTVKKLHVIRSTVGASGKLGIAQQKPRTGVKRESYSVQDGTTIFFSTSSSKTLRSSRSIGGKPILSQGHFHPSLGSEPAQSPPWAIPLHTLTHPHLRTAHQLKSVCHRLLQLFHSHGPILPHREKNGCQYGVMTWNYQASFTYENSRGMARKDSVLRHTWSLPCSLYLRGIAPFPFLLAIPIPSFPSPSFLFGCRRRMREG